VRFVKAAQAAGAPAMMITWLAADLVGRQVAVIVAPRGNIRHNAYVV
jgi:hypothetical protein